jgi:hypothetical protein
MSCVALDWGRAVPVESHAPFRLALVGKHAFYSQILTTPEFCGILDSFAVLAREESGNPLLQDTCR